MKVVLTRKQHQRGENDVLPRIYVQISRPPTGRRMVEELDKNWTDLADNFNLPPSNGDGSVARDNIEGQGYNIWRSVPASMTGYFSLQAMKAV